MKTGARLVDRLRTRIAKRARHDLVVDPELELARIEIDAFAAVWAKEREVNEVVARLLAKKALAMWQAGRAVRGDGS